MLFLPILGCSSETTPSQPAASLTSPDGKTQVTLTLNDAGEAIYWITREQDTIVSPSMLGFTFEGGDSLAKGLTWKGQKSSSFSEAWELPWGEQREVKNEYNQLTVHLASPGTVKIVDLIFKAFDDGVGFRYHFPAQTGVDTLLILNELTQFNMHADHDAWWIPGDWDIYEHLYSHTKISEIDALKHRDNKSLGWTTIPYNAVNTPITMKSASGTHISLHEAALVNYPGMTLMKNEGSLGFNANLVASKNHAYKAKVPVPFSTPWRTIQIADQAGDLIESKMILNLNEPNKIGDVSWFKPMKYVGIWWEMHLGKSSWDVAAGKHGATTENAKRYIDFASENNIKGLLVEGWNTGWERWIGFPDREGVFDFVTPYPDYDLNEVVRYGKEKGVDVIMHHETSAAIGTYNKQMDTAYKLMQSLDIHAVKSGYVGDILPGGEYHHGQWMVNHYNNAVAEAAKYQIAVNAHEPIKATGLRRTYPNAIAREGLRGQEFNAWAADGGNPTDHLPIVAFTRMLGGPIDYTPGIFNLTLTPFKENNRVQTTLAQQLALYVVIYSPVQMAADLPEHYEDQPGLQFIRDVGVDWEQTKVLEGEIGQYVTIAREERETGNWFLGSITGFEAHSGQIALDFLPAGKTFTATVYKDGADAHWDTNPTALTIDTIEVNSTSVIDLNLAPGGGTAISLIAQ